MFSVMAIPHTFTIDADGVLQEEQIGDASIEGKLKKLIAGARELEQPQNSAKRTQIPGLVARTSRGFVRYVSYAARVRVRASKPGALYPILCAVRGSTMFMVQRFAFPLRSYENILDR